MTIVLVASLCLLWMLVAINGLPGIIDRLPIVAGVKSMKQPLTLEEKCRLIVIALCFFSVPVFLVACLIIMAGIR